MATILKNIIYTRPDGGVDIVCPAIKEDLEKVLGPLTDENYEVHVWERSVPEWAINPKYVEKHDIPSDRYFRDGWKVDGNAVTVDMEKAREIHMQNIRIKRNRELAILDIRTMQGENVQAEKQALRDIPQNFDLSSAETPEQLKELWPQQLKKG